MGCTTLEVEGVPSMPEIELLDIGFGEIEGENQMFIDCNITAAEAANYHEAIGLKYRVSGLVNPYTVWFVTEFTRPSGSVVHWEWQKTFDSGDNGKTFTYYRYATSKMYEAGKYTGLIGSINM